VSDLRDRFEADRPFPLDPFQHEALDALDAGRSVLVAAPTGAGKTLVAEYAVATALDEGRKVFYTTPLKALSNQKYGDFVRLHGAAQVGLLTGDNSVNGEAPLVVMTTEVLRNMIYAGSPTLRGLRYVVLDEVHYLQNPYRGAVWEEVIIHLPLDVDLVCLSATVSNAEEVATWIQTVRGETTAVIEETRPVELRHLYLVGDRAAEQLHLLPTFVSTDGQSVPNPEAERLDQRETPNRGQRGRRRSRLYTPWRSEVVERLAEGGRHQGVVAEVEPRAGDPETQLEEALEAAAGPPLLLVLDGVQDPHNLGACLRSADAAGVAAVIVPRDRAAGLTPVVRKVAAGAAESVPLVAVINLARTLRQLKERGVWLVGTDDAAGRSLFEADLTGPVALVMGSEGEGLRRLTRDCCDQLVSIPMAGAVESLNVSVAAGVALFEAVRQRAAGRANAKKK